MKKRVGQLTLVLLLLVFCLPAAAFAAPLPCTTPTSATQGNLCILEFQTRGATGSEAEDFVIIQNTTTTKFTTTNLQLQYLNDQGILGERISLGSFDPGEIKTYISDSLVATNPSVSKLTPIVLQNSGGSIRVARATSSTNPTPTVIYDQVSWGSGIAKEGLPLAILPAGSTFARHNINGIIQDVDDNDIDFDINPLDCTGADINEIQPFVTDEAGGSIDAWVEFNGTSTTNGDCLLLTANSDSYTIPAADLPVNGEAKVVNRVLDSQNNVVPLHIGDSSGQVWLAGLSQYGAAAAVRIPLTTQAYTNLAKGQSWALVDGVWYRTFAPTPDAPNIYQANALVLDDDPTACDTVRISELLPNPAGDDTDNEWLELHNESEETAPLGHCLVNVAGSTYVFLPDDALGPFEWRTVAKLFDSEGSEKTINLHNSGDTQVSLQRIRTGGNETVQSFLYSGAPEDQAWARFDNGWQWTYALTPGQENVLQTTPSAPNVTEFAAAASAIDSIESGAKGGTTPSPTVLITELLPNPASPQTDENDEFVELYNPGTEPVSLDGYKVQTGSNYTYSFTLDHQNISAGGYLILTSGATGLTLSNTAGRARLLDPAGNVLSETDPYENADEGAAWAFIDGKWGWTAAPSSGATNIFTALSTASTKTTPTKKAATAKVATAKTASTSVKAAKTTKPKSTTTASSGTSGTSSKAPLHSGILAGVGGLAVLYGAYEYRGDIGNQIYKLKRNRANRRANRSGP
jgi:hypothetical protein